MFESCGKRVLLVDDGVGNTLPELSGFVRKLFFDWWDDLGDNRKRVNIDKQIPFLFLSNC